MKVRWNDLSEEMIEYMSSAIIRLSSRLNVVDVAVLTYSLGALETPLDTLQATALTEALYTAIVYNLPTMKATQISKIIWGLASMSVSWNMLPYSLCWQLNVALRR